MDKSMVSVKRIVLDVLKPHQPNALEFSQAVAHARCGKGCVPSDDASACTGALFQGNPMASGN
jgi:hypothetical protein